ncbi:hypothetical protein Tco_1137471 [Tanacetum coccineum]
MCSLSISVTLARWPPWFKVAGRGRCSCSLLGARYNSNAARFFVAMMIIFCVSFRQGALYGFLSLWKGGHRGLRLLSWTMFVFTLRYVLKILPFFPLFDNSMGCDDLIPNVLEAETTYEWNFAFFSVYDICMTFHALFFPRIAFPDRLLLLGLASADVPFGLP